MINVEGVAEGIATRTSSEAQHTGDFLRRLLEPIVRAGQEYDSFQSINSVLGISLNLSIAAQTRHDLCYQEKAF